MDIDCREQRLVRINDEKIGHSRKVREGPADHMAYRWHEVTGFANLTRRTMRSWRTDNLIMQFNDKVVRRPALIAWLVESYVNIPTQYSMVA